jgi:hypothetical protein
MLHVEEATARNSIAEEKNERIIDLRLDTVINAVPGIVQYMMVSIVDSVLDVNC